MVYCINPPPTRSYRVEAIVLDCYGIRVIEKLGANKLNILLVLVWVREG